MWTIEYSTEATKTLNRLPGNISTLIRRKIEALAANPYARNNNVKALKGEPGFRLRIGDWRVVYLLQDEILTVVVVRIAPRGKAYR